MAIPDLKPQYETRAKVKIGERKGKYPSSVDHFISDDPEVPAGVKALTVVFPYDDVDDNFSTGLEWWVQTKDKRNQLACYTKDSGSEPVALRLEPYLDDQHKVVGEKLKQGRVPIGCTFRQCPQFRDRKCKPMGRLVFFIKGGRTDQVLQLDTKGWNSIEKLTGTLRGARLRGPLAGRHFILSVSFERRGTDRFPVLSLEEVDVEVNNEQDARVGDAVIALEQARAAGKTAREQLAAMLDQMRPGWRDDQRYIERIKEVGVEAALAKLEAAAA